MSAELLKADHWTGNLNRDEEKRWPNSEDITRVIGRLDGVQFTSVYINYDSERDMVISGGNEGRFVVNIIIDTDREFYNLTNGQASSDDEIIVASGGQMGSWQKQYVVDAGTALAAAVHFAETGLPKGDFHWEHSD
jgi:hypothetical protein